MLWGNFHPPTFHFCVGSGGRRLLQVVGKCVRHVGLRCCAIQHSVIGRVVPNISSQRSVLEISGISYPVMRHCIPEEQNLCFTLFILIHAVCTAATEKGNG